MKDLSAFVNALVHHHDPYANSHGANTATLCIALAKLTNYPSKKMDGLRFAAQLHDTGKVLIDERVLNKIGKLTNDDIAYIRRHTIVGHDALKAYGAESYIVDAVLYHHENWDGTGYPAGLKGEAIPLEARMIRIADTFDSLTTRRAYRGALSVSDAIRIMDSDRRVFDPILLDVFLRHIVHE